MSSEDEDRVVSGGELPDDDNKGDKERFKDPDKEKSRPTSSTILPAIRPKKTASEEEAREEKQLRQGLEALKAYELERLSECADFAAAASQLHNRDHAEIFKQKVLEIGEVVCGGTKAWFEFLNHNSYLAGAMDFVDNYFSDNPDEAKKLVENAEEQIGIKLTECGFDRSVYQDVVEAVKQKGIIGDGSGLDVLVEVGIRNLGSIVKAVQESEADLRIPKGTLNYMGKPVERQPTDLAEICRQCKITVQGVKRTYKKGKITGYGGVGHYLIGKIVSGMAGEYEEELKEINLKPSEIVNAYKNHGIVAKGGIVDVIAKAMLESLPNAGEIAYNAVLHEVLKEKKEAMKKQAQMSVQERIGETEIERLVEQRFEAPLKVIKSLGVPSELDKEVLLDICKEHGMFGSNGLISYFADNAGKILAIAESLEVVEPSDIERYAAKTRNIAHLNTFADLLGAFSGITRTSYEKFAIAAAKKAEELGVPVSDLVGNPEYMEERMNLKKEVYGGVLEAYQAQMIAITGALPLVDAGLLAIQSGEVNIAEIVEQIKGEIPKQVITRKIFDYAVEKYVKPQLIEIVEDYASLLRNTMACRFEQLKTEMLDYVKSQNRRE